MIPRWKFSLRGQRLWSESDSTYVIMQRQLHVQQDRKRKRNHKNTLNEKKVFLESLYARANEKTLQMN